MALEIDNEWPEKLLRGWAQAYRDSPEYRFPSDPSAEFFPVDLEEAANEIERLREENDRFRKTLEVIAGSSDKLQATQALGALANIGAAVR